MKLAWMMLLVLVGGCAPYAQVQIDLLQHVRTGLHQTRQSLQRKSQLIAEYHQLRRRQLDGAFDADVRARTELESDWVIEHRKAYAAAIDAIGSARTHSELANESDQRNLDAIDAALQRVIWLQSLQTRWILPAQETQYELD